MIGFVIAIEAMNGGKILLDFSYPSRDDRSLKTMWYLRLGKYELCKFYCYRRRSPNCRDNYMS